MIGIATSRAISIMWSPAQPWPTFASAPFWRLAAERGRTPPCWRASARRCTPLTFRMACLPKPRTRCHQTTVTFTVADLTRPWPCAARSADLIVCNLVLEHIGDLSFVFAEAARVLVPGGRFFVCELHPFRQYQGAQARFDHDQTTTEIQAFVHHLSDFIHAAEANGLVLEQFQEWWHEEDQDKPPRLVSFMFKKSPAGPCCR